MSYNLEWVYRSEGIDVTTPNLSSSLQGAIKMLQVGSYIWVSCGTNGIAIYQYFGSNSDDEPLWTELDSLTYRRYDSGLNRKLRLVTFIKITTTQVLRTTVDSTFVTGSPTVTTLDTGEVANFTSTAMLGNALNAYYMTTDGTNVYVTNGNTDFTEVFVFSVSGQNYSSKITFDEPMNSNLCYSNGRLWTVNSAFTDSIVQKLCVYNISAGTSIKTDIPVRPSNARSWIADGYNSKIYVTNYNQLSVTRFSNTGTFGATIRVNSSPTRVFSFPDGRIYVSSYAGMLSKVDGSTDAVLNSWGTEAACLALSPDPVDTDKIWFTSAAGNIGRQSLSTLRQTEINQTTDDWVWTNDRFSQYVPAQAIAPLKNASVSLGHTKLVTNKVFDGVKTYNTGVVVKNAAGTATLIEFIDYTVNTDTGALQFLSTSTVVTSTSVPTALQVSYSYFYYFPTDSLITPGTTYLSGGTTITVNPYLFFISSNKIFAIRLDTYLLNKPASTGVTGQGAIVSGTQQYFGD